MDRAAVAEVAGQLTGVGLIVLFVATDRSIYWIIAAVVVGSLVNMAVLLGLAGRAASARPLSGPAGGFPCSAKPCRSVSR